MKLRSKGKIILYIVDGLLFLAGSVMTMMHRYDPSQTISSRHNILAISAASVLTIAEVVLIFVIGMVFDGKTRFRRGSGYVLSLLMLLTITWAISVEGKAVFEEGQKEAGANVLNSSLKDNMELLKDEKTGKVSSKAKERLIASNQSNIKEIVADIKFDNTALYVNMLAALFAGMTAAFLSPSEPIKRKAGNVMSPEIKEAAERKIGFGIPSGATAFEDGHGNGWNIKSGRTYIGYVSKNDLQK